MLGGFQRPATLWALPLEILEQALVRNILPLHPVVALPFGKIGHPQFGGKVGAGKMILHAVVAFARLGAIKSLDVEQLRRVLQPIVIHGRHLRDARITVERRGVSRRPRNIPFPLTRAARFRIKAEQIIADRRSSARQADNNQRRPDILCCNLRVALVVFHKAEPCRKLPDDIVRREVAELIIRSHRFDRRDEPFKPLTPAGIGAEVRKPGGCPRCGLEPGDGQRLGHQPSAFAIKSSRSA